MAETVAYQLRKEFEENFAGGNFALRDGSAFDVGRALDEGDGTITVNATDDALVSLLDEYAALKRVRGGDTADVTATGYDHLKVADLRDEAARRGLNHQGLSKAELIDLLTTNDREA